MLLGTLLDVYTRGVSNRGKGAEERQPGPGRGASMLTCFSLVTNMEFIFQAAPPAPAPGWTVLTGSAR